jgi:hypothetical protein
MTYKYTSCGEIHDDLPDLISDRPTYAAATPEEEFADRVQLDEDLCIVDKEHYFIRGVLRIPIHEEDQDLGLGVWVSQKKENFD